MGACMGRSAQALLGRDARCAVLGIAYPREIAGGQATCLHNWTWAEEQVHVYHNAPVHNLNLYAREKSRPLWVPSMSRSTACIQGACTVWIHWVRPQRACTVCT